MKVTTVLVPPLLAVALLASTTGTAGAASQPGTARHCVVELSHHNALTCYSSFSEAIAKATGGRVTNAPADPAAAVRNPRFNAAVNAAGGSGAGPSAGFVTSIEFQHVDFGGDSHTFTNGSACSSTTSDVDAQVASLGPIGWNDRISSFQTYSNCRVDHFEDLDFAGSHTGYQETRSGIGLAMNDQTTSLRWT